MRNQLRLGELYSYSFLLLGDLLPAEGGKVGIQVRGAAAPIGGRPVSRSGWGFKFHTYGSDQRNVR